MFHKHQWKEIARTFAAPIKSIKGMIINGWFLERAMSGITTIVWRCEKCQKIKKEELLGKIIK